MSVNQAKKVYCVGIGGIGVSAIARILALQGRLVAGSDMRESQVTQQLIRLGVQVYIGHDAGHIKSFAPDLVIYSEDVSDTSPGFVEIQEAKQAGAVLMTQAQALGYFMEGKYGIAVSGTNGKSTTTIMTGLMLEDAGLDPMILAGTMVSQKNESAKFQANARMGGGKYVVAEADEYRAKMLLTHPKVAVITNIAEDHLDYYKSLNDIKDAFTKFILSIPEDGIVIYNADDHSTVDVCRHAKGHKATFGIKHYADLQAINIRHEEGRQVFNMHYKDEDIGEFELHVPGEFNIANALAASLTALRLGVSPDSIRKTLSRFVLPWRRFEEVGKIGNTKVFSDYAHHPAGVEATIKAAQEFYPGKKILTVFQPHHRNRTKMLFRDFVTSLIPASKIIIPEIFDVAGREHGESISSEDLVLELKQQGVDAEYASDLAEAKKTILELASSYDVILMMGAGDIDGLARSLVK